MTLQAALDALEHDAKLWDDTAATLKTQAGVVSGLRLTWEFSNWLTWFTDVETDYEDARAHVEDLLDAGAAELGTLADTLREIKRVYEDTDATNDARFHGLWDPVR